MKQLVSKMMFILTIFTANVMFTYSNPLDVEIDIPYTQYVLDNGLRLIVHEDHKAPIVAVNIWYHVGSKNEKPGKTGFAHLFEHLMFNGSENFDDDYFQALEPIGATDLNGTTWFDRTNYFQNVPTSALDRVLWLESDRMGHLVGAITQDKLDEQRGVVQNEKRQGENQPYGKVDELLAKYGYPKGHPLSWTTIGSMEDLDAASLDDVKEWFKQYYGAANAVIAIAGDVDAEDVKQRVEKYFGDIPSGPPLSKPEVWIAKRKETKRVVTYDRVPQARIYRVWNVPQWGTEDMAYLDLASDVLSQGKTSRLYKRLVYDDQIATDVSASISPYEITGNFTIQATAKSGVDLKTVEEAIEEELQSFLKKGPTGKELKRVKIQYVSRFVRGIERIGGFGGKSDILASNTVYGDDPEYYKKRLTWIKEATQKDLVETAREWLSSGDLNLEVFPFPEYSTIKTNVDRSKLPTPDEMPDAKFPDFTRATLSNGMKLLVAERHAVPIVRMTLMIDAGYAADQLSAPGTAGFAMAMLDEGTQKRDALEISDELAMLGASLGASSDLDFCDVSFSSLTSTLDDSLDLFTDVVLNPAFAEKEFDRLKKERLAAIQREKVTPVPMALRVFPKLIYGEGHAYSNPYTGTGTEASLQAMTVEDLHAFHNTWFKPNNATLIVVGDTTADAIAPLIEKAFHNWEAGDVPKKNVSEVAHKDKSEVYLIDRPGSIQSLLIVGQIAPPTANPFEIALETMNYNLGGSFTSRINMNLREDKHWSYGARSLLLSARGQRPFMVYSNVQSDKTAESMKEIQKELEQILGDKPLTDAELQKAKLSMTLKLPGSWETASAVASSIEEIVEFGYPDDYFKKYPELVKSVQLKDAQNAAEKVLRPNRLVWVVVGDREKIEPSIKKIGFDTIVPIDVDGNRLD